jgi:carbon-monoxide dehydrogenase large subunit
MRELPLEPPASALRGRWVGRRLERFEDPRLLTGAGRFLADLEIPGALHAAFHRSLLPFARLRNVDVAAARERPGVRAALKAADIPHVPLVDALPIDGLAKTPQPALAPDRVRFVGEAVALVLADDRYQAEDGAEAVAVEYEELRPVVDAEAAAAADAEVPGEAVDEQALAEAPEAAEAEAPEAEVAESEAPAEAEAETPAAADESNE